MIVFSSILTVARDDPLMSWRTSVQAERPTRLSGPRMGVGMVLARREADLDPQ